MPSERIERDELEGRWRQNESELNRIAGMSGLDRELHGPRQEALERDQDDIEHVLGFNSSADVGSRSWSRII